MSSPLPQRSLRVPRLAGAAVERARLTVVPRLRPRSSRVPFVTLVSLLLLGGVIGLLMFNTTMQQDSFKATALEGRSAELSAQKQGLQMELESLRNPQLVGEKAQKMGMVPALDPAVVDLKTDRVLGKAIPAGPANRLDVRAPRAPAPSVPKPKKVVVPADSRDAADARRDARRDTRASDTGSTSDNRSPRRGRNG